MKALSPSFTTKRTSVAMCCFRWGWYYESPIAFTVQMRRECWLYRCWDYCLFHPEGVLDGGVCYSWLSYRDLFSLSLSMQLQKLKRSLSFKTLMRSKSVENFFQRSFSDARMPLEFTTDPPPPSPPLLPGSPLVNNRSPSISPSVSPNPSISSHSPSLSLSPSLPAKPPHPQITHCFQDHVFRKPTNCQHCMNTIVGKKLILLVNLQLSMFLSYLKSGFFNVKTKLFFPLETWLCCSVFLFVELLVLFPCIKNVTS